MEVSLRFIENFSWAVPTGFTSVLNSCRFESGDILFDNKKAYEGRWGDVKEYIRYSLQVKYPKRNEVINKPEINAELFQKNWGTEAHVDLYENSNFLRSIKTTQSAIYMTIWKNDISYLEDSSKIKPLRTLKDVVKNLDDLRDRALELSSGNSVFVTAFDNVNQLSLDKKKKLRTTIAETFALKVVEMSPKEAGVNDFGLVVPTIDMVFFVVDKKDGDLLTEKVKEAVYVPNPNAKKSLFLIKRHGSLF
jgi:hypothetical protein